METSSFDHGLQRGMPCQTSDRKDRHSRTSHLWPVFPVECSGAFAPRLLAAETETEYVKVLLTNLGEMQTMANRFRFKDANNDS